MCIRDRGGDELSVRIEKKPAIRILGIACPLAKNLEQNFKAVPDQWQAAVVNGKLIELVLMNNAYPNALLGVSIHHGEEWKYMIASASTINNHDYEEYFIQAGSWAVFSGQGDNRSLQALQRRVLLEWLPTSGYECEDVYKRQALPLHIGLMMFVGIVLFVISIAFSNQHINNHT